MPRRRSVLLGTAALAAGLARPAAARAAAATTLRFIPQVDLAFLDPHWTTANVSRNHGHMVFDTLYGCDTTFRPSPQMLDGHRVEDDGLTWLLFLRPGLVWHDGERVLARDCAASIRRWSKRDSFGAALMAATAELSAPDDRTIRFRLRKPFPLLPDALGKAPTYMAAMMPERLAATDPGTQVTEMVGSGPFRYLADERVQGAHNAYARFDRYVPRQDGTTDWYSGPKVVHFDRVEWTTIPDPATAANALLAGEQDWWEQASADLQPMLRRNRAVTVDVLDPTGTVGMLRPNWVQPPFDNPRIRRAALQAIDQAACMQSVVGDPAMFTAPIGVFTPGGPMASDAGMDALRRPPPTDVLRKEVADAGYKGETAAIIVPQDYQYMRLMGEVVSENLRAIGLRVEYIATDWATMLQRRNNRGPVDKGGWSAFITAWTGSDWLNPATHLSLRGNGDAGYPGWASSPALEALRERWFDAATDAGRRAAAADMQKQALDDVIYMPLGQFAQATAYRGITGVLKGFATFWNVRPA